MLPFVSEAMDGRFDFLECHFSCHFRSIAGRSSFLVLPFGVTVVAKRVKAGTEGKQHPCFHRACARNVLVGPNRRRERDSIVTISSLCHGRGYFENNTIESPEYQRGSREMRQSSKSTQG